MFTGDYVVEPAGGQFTFSTAASDAISTAPGFEATANIRVGIARIFGSQIDINAIEGRASKVLELDWKAGSQRLLDNLGANEVIVDNDYAESHDLKLGSPVPLVTPTGETLDLKVAGIFEPPPGGSPFFPVTLAAQRFDKAFENPQNEFSLVKMKGGDSPANSKALENALKNFPNARSQTRAEWVDSLIDDLNQVLMILYVLLAFSVLISFFGIVNTLVLTVFERTRELGMLRAVGMTRRQARRMIRQESVITSLIGAFLGIALGLVFGALLVGRIEEFEFTVPMSQLVLFAIAAVIVGVVAAILPARRAARLNVLEALQYE